MEILDSIIAVVVLSKSSLNDAVSVRCLSESISATRCSQLDLVIYDNSPQYNEGINYYNERFNVFYIPDYTNSGVSKAYNIACKIGRERGKKYLLLLDQDTVISDSYCSDLLSLDEAYSLIVPKLVHNDIIISPCKYVLGRASSLEQNECSRGIKSIKHRNFLNSGSLISIGLFDKVGGFDESLSLYFSYCNFFNRVRKYENYYYQLDTTFFHEMSSNDESDLGQFARRFELYCKGALRCYKGFFGKSLMIINILLRSIKVGFRHKMILFTKIALREIYVYFIK